MAEKISILLDTTNDLLDKIVKENQKQKGILEQLSKLEQPYKLILEKIYIRGEKLVTVASEMNYSYRDLCRKHKIALNKFDKINSVLFCPWMSYIKYVLIYNEINHS